MANRQNFPSSLFPLRGDISAEAGQTTVTVEGIQTQPVDPAVPDTGDTFIYEADGVWHPGKTNASVLVNGIPVSDDYDFLVNNHAIDGIVNWPYGYASQVYQNGAAI